MPRTVRRADAFCRCATIIDGRIRRPFANRVRLLCELIEETKEAVGAECAVAARVRGRRNARRRRHDGSGEDAQVHRHACRTAGPVGRERERLGERLADIAVRAGGLSEEFVRFVKTVTSKPVVGVGRFTSPDTMVSQIRRGVLDFIGAARPSIADPLLHGERSTAARPTIFANA